MENFNILSIGGFSFFLLVIVKGYYIVEILFGKYYPFRKSIKRYNNSILNRLIHYFTWGILGNILFLYFHYFSGSFEGLFNIFNIAGPLAQEIDIQFGEGGLGFKIIAFDIFYFTIFILLTGLFYGAGRFGVYLGSKTPDNIYNFIFNREKGEKKKSKKKKKKSS